MTFDTVTLAAVVTIFVTLPKLLALVAMNVQLRLAGRCTHTVELGRDAERAESAECEVSRVTQAFGGGCEEREDACATGVTVLYCSQLALALCHCRSLSVIPLVVSTLVQANLHYAL